MYCYFLSILTVGVQAAGLCIKAEKHKMRVPRSQRGGEVIEPMVSEQWFVRMEVSFRMSYSLYLMGRIVGLWWVCGQGMAQKAVEAAQNRDIVFVPERFDKV